LITAITAAATQQITITICIQIQKRGSSTPAYPDYSMIA
jgi:hypothetical protein